MSWNYTNYHGGGPPHSGPGGGNNGGGRSRNRGGGYGAGGSYNSRGGFGRGGNGGGANYRGDVNDEVVGGLGGPGGGNFPRGMFPNFGPMFNPAGFPRFPGFQGYGIPPQFPGHYGGFNHFNRLPFQNTEEESSNENKRNYDQDSSQSKTPDRNLTSTSRNKEEKLESKEKNEPGTQIPPKYKSEPDASKDTADGANSARDSSRGSVSPISLGSKGPQSPLSDKASTNNRRKQSTPQKVPVGNSPTSIITKKGLTIPENDIDYTKSTTSVNQNNASLKDEIKQFPGEDRKQEEKMAETPMNLKKSLEKVSNTPADNSQDNLKDRSLQPQIEEKRKGDFSGTQSIEISTASSSSIIPSSSNQQSILKPCPVVLPRKSKGEMKSYSEVPPLIPVSKEIDASPSPRRTGRNRDKPKNYQEKDYESQVEEEDEIRPAKKKKISQDKLLPENQEKGYQKVDISKKTKGNEEQISIKTTHEDQETVQIDQTKKNPVQDKPFNKEKDIALKKDKVPIKMKPDLVPESDKPKTKMPIQKEKSTVNDEQSSLKNSKPSDKNSLPTQKEKEVARQAQTPKRKSEDPKVKDSTGTPAPSTEKEMPNMMTPRSKRMSAHKALMSLKMKEMTEYAMENLTSPSRKSSSKKVKKDKKDEKLDDQVKSKPTKTPKNDNSTASIANNEIKIVKEVERSQGILIAANEAITSAPQVDSEAKIAVNEKAENNPKGNAKSKPDRKITPKRTTSAVKSNSTPADQTPKRTSTRLTSPATIAKNTNKDEASIAVMSKKELSTSTSSKDTPQAEESPIAKPTETASSTVESAMEELFKGVSSPLKSSSEVISIPSQSTTLSSKSESTKSTLSTSIASKAVSVKEATTKPVSSSVTPKKSAQTEVATVSATTKSPSAKATSSMPSKEVPSESPVIIGRRKLKENLISPRKRLKPSEPISSELESSDTDQIANSTRRNKRRAASNITTSDSDYSVEQKASKGTLDKSCEDLKDVSPHATRRSSRKRFSEEIVILDDNSVDMNKAAEDNDRENVTVNEAKTDSKAERSGRDSVILIDESESVNQPKKVNKQVSKAKRKESSAPSRKRTIDESQPSRIQSGQSSPVNKKKSGGKVDWKGPYIHIEGLFHSPRVVKVVNSEPSEEKKDKRKDKKDNQKVVKRGLHDAEHRARSANIGHSSTISKEYDHKNVDETWKCVFCHQRTWYRGLGDLFGPYFVKMENDDLEKQAAIPAKNVSSKSGRSKRGEKEVINQGEEEGEEEREVWFHEDCLVWIPCIYVIGSRVIGIEDGVNLCAKSMCMICGLNGASLVCTRPGCRNAVHVPCSLDSSWLTQIDNFQASCSNCVNKPR